MRAFKPLFNGKNLDGWAGAVENYEVVDGVIRCKAGKGGVLHTKDEYADFVARVEFKLPPGGNNGLAIRYPGQGDNPRMSGCANCRSSTTSTPSTKVLIPARHTVPPTVWPPLIADITPGRRVELPGSDREGLDHKVELNGTVILDTDLSKITEYMANSPHPGKDRTTASSDSRVTRIRSNSATSASKSLSAQ